MKPRPKRTIQPKRRKPITKTQVAQRTDPHSPRNIAREVRDQVNNYRTRSTSDLLELVNYFQGALEKLPPVTKKSASADKALRNYFQQTIKTIYWILYQRGDLENAE